MKCKLVAVLLTLSVSLSQSQANTHKMENNKDKASAHLSVQPNVPFPMQTGFTDEYLRATFWKCNYNSAGVEHAYWVILPNTIKPTSVDPKKLPQVGLTNIGVYNTIDKTLPYIEVWVAYEKLNSKQSPAEWLLNKIHITGETILKQSPITYPDGQKNVDVLTVKTIGNGEKVISRFTGVHRGDNYFVLKASCNEKDYKGQANNIFHIVSHWGLK